jgi:Zn-dependent oligopeptidase
MNIYYKDNTINFRIFKNANFLNNFEKYINDSKVIIEKMSKSERISTLNNFYNPIGEIINNIDNISNISNHLMVDNCSKYEHINDRVFEIYNNFLKWMLANKIIKTKFNDIYKYKDCFNYSENDLNNIQVIFELYGRLRERGQKIDPAIETFDCIEESLRKKYEANILKSTISNKLFIQSVDELEGLSIKVIKNTEITPVNGGFEICLNSIIVDEWLRNL